MKKKGIRKDLIEFRKQCGMNQSEFATALGIQGGTLSNYESGRRDPELSIVQTMIHSAKQKGIDLPVSLFMKEVANEVISNEYLFITDSINEMREYLGKSQKEIAKDCGLHYRTFARYERGETRPLAETWFTLKRYAQQYGINLVNTDTEVQDDGRTL